MSLDGVDGLDGNDAWSPVLALVPYGAGHVVKVTDWQNGTGTPPAAPVFLGPSGYVADAASASVLTNSAAIAFKAVRAGGANQSGTAGGFTKLLFDQEMFDTHNFYDADIDHWFKPLVAGWYEVNLQVGSPTGGGGETCQATIRKNGAQVASGLYLNTSGSVNFNSSVQDVIYLNGATDYIEAWVYLPAGMTVINGAAAISHFSVKRIA